MKAFLILIFICSPTLSQVIHPFHQLLRQASIPHTPLVLRHGNIPRAPVMLGHASIPRTPAILRHASISRAPVIIRHASIPNTPVMHRHASIPHRPIISFAPLPQFPRFPSTRAVIPEMPRIPATSGIATNVATSSSQQTIDGLISQSTPMSGVAYMDYQNEPVYRFQYDILMKSSEMDHMVSQARRSTNPNILIRKKRKVRIGPRWPNGIVYVRIDPTSEFSQAERDLVFEAMREWESRTCIRFMVSMDNSAFSDGTHHVLITNGDGCGAHVGYGTREMDGNLNYQLLILGTGCRHHSIIVHELGHSLGLEHEMSRPDRDQYVRINLQNVDPSQYFNFLRQSSTDVDTLGISYDYTSIMHYSKDTFSSNGLPTIETLDPRYQDVIGTARNLSDGDARAINTIYRCSSIGKKKK